MVVTVGAAWLVLADFGVPAARWFEEHRAVRPVLLAVIGLLLLVLLVTQAGRLS